MRPAGTLSRYGYGCEAYATPVPAVGERSKRISRVGASRDRSNRAANAVPENPAPTIAMVRADWAIDASAYSVPGA